MNEYPERLPYTSRYWHRYGVDDDHVWSRRNYLVHDKVQNVLVLARRPFYIETVEIRGKDPTPFALGSIAPIFTPAAVAHVRNLIEASWRVRGLARNAAELALLFDDYGTWPETDPICRAGDEAAGLLTLRTKANGSLGPAVIDLLQWHGVLVKIETSMGNRLKILKLDHDALDLWSVAATLIAEGWTYR